MTMTTPANSTKETINDNRVLNTDRLQIVNGVYIPIVENGFKQWEVEFTNTDYKEWLNQQQGYIKEVTEYNDGYAMYVKDDVERNGITMSLLHILIRNGSVQFTLTNEVCEIYTSDIRYDMKCVLEQLVTVYGLEWNIDDMLKCKDDPEWGYVDDGYTDPMYFEFSPDEGVITKFNYELMTEPMVIVIPPKIDGVEVVGIAPEAFYRYYTREVIEAIALPDSIQYIGDKAFTGVDTMKNFYFLGDIRYIGNESFNGCSSLEKITIPEGVRKLYSGTFKGCTSLETATLIGVTEVESGCFEANTKIIYTER